MKQIHIHIVMLLLLLTVAISNSSCDKPVEPKQYTVGVFNPNPGTWNICDGFMKKLTESIESKGNKVTFIKKKCGTPCDIDSELEMLTTQKPDLLFTVTTPATKKAKAITKEKGIPVIFAMYDPISSGVIKSLHEPGGNHTGIQIRGSTAKGLEWLFTLAPDIKHIYVPIKFDTKAARQSLTDLQQTADILGIQVSTDELQNQKELEEALASLPEEIDAIFLLHSILTSKNAQKIAEEAVKRGLPTGAASSISNKGILISFGINRGRLGQQAARLAHMVLRGEKAENLPSEMAEFSLGLNLQTASQLGIHISDDIIIQADTVYR